MSARYAGEKREKPAHAPVRRDVRIRAGARRVPDGRGVRRGVVLQEALDSALLVVGHLEVVAEAAAGEDDLLASTLGRGHLCAWVHLCGADARDVRAGAWYNAIRHTA